MNERIREFAISAGYKPLSPPTFADELDEIFMRKFAELIIQKCAMIGNYAYDGGEYPSKMIKEYFGVE